MKMRYLHTILAALLLPLLAAGATKAADPPADADPVADASQAFVRLPKDFLPLLDRNTRLDMLDYYAVDSIYPARNMMRGISRLDTVAPDYLKVSVTDVSTYELRLLPLASGGSIVAAVYTISNPLSASDSRISFFDQQMRPLPTEKYFKFPAMKDLISVPKGAPESRSAIEALLPFPTIEYSLSPSSCALSGELTVGGYLTREDYDRLKPYLIRKMLWQWDGKKYKLTSGK